MGVADSGWGQFLSSLTEREYFKGELEGSQLYRTLYTDARHYYDSVVKNDLDKLLVTVATVVIVTVTMTTM